MKALRYFFTAAPTLVSVPLLAASLGPLLLSYGLNTDLALEEDYFPADAEAYNLEDVSWVNLDAAKSDTPATTGELKRRISFDGASIPVAARSIAKPATDQTDPTPIFRSAQTAQRPTDIKLGTTHVTKTMTDDMSRKLQSFTPFDVAHPAEIGQGLRQFLSAKNLLGGLSTENNLPSGTSDLLNIAVADGTETKGPLDILAEPNVPNSLKRSDQITTTAAPVPLPASGALLLVFCAGGLLIGPRRR